MEVLTAVAIVALSAVGAGLGAYAKEYFRSRGRKEGEIDAVRRNLDQVLRQLRETTRVTEGVRASISGGLWVEKEKWKLKRDAYMTLLQSLSSFAQMYVEVRVRGGSSGEQMQRFGQLLAEHQQAHPNAASDSQHALLVARLIMVPESFQALEALTRDFAMLMKGAACAGDRDLDQLFAAHRRAFDTLVEAARRDLKLEAVERRDEA